MTDWAVNTQRNQRAGRGVPLRLLALLAVVLFLGMLAVAETVWIPDSMPREHVASSSLALVPRRGVPAADPQEWMDRVARLANDHVVLASVITKLELKNGTLGELLSPDQLREQLRVSAECILVIDEQSGPERGALLSIGVRGGDKAELTAIAGAWVDAFVERSSISSTYPDVALGAPYLPCVEN